MFEYMPLFCYEQWYHQDVKSGLTMEQKISIAKKISELSLREPIYEANRKYKKRDFPELVPFSHTNDDCFTGMQLYAVFTEIMRELGCNVPSASGIALKK